MYALNSNISFYFSLITIRADDFFFFKKHGISWKSLLKFFNLIYKVNSKVMGQIMASRLMVKDHSPYSTYLPTYLPLNCLVFIAHLIY